MKNKQELRVGIIGCGVIAADHLGAIRDKCQPVQLFLCDRNVKAAEKLNSQLRLHGQIYEDPLKCIDGNSLDIVHVLTPPDSHYDLARYALERGAHVLVEKPMTLRGEETESLFALARKVSRKICVDHSLLQMDCVLKMLERVRSGQMGRVISAHCFFGHAEKKRTIPYGGVSHWAYNMPGGPLINLLSHPASVLVEVLGIPEEVTVTKYARHIMPGGLSDVMHVGIRSAKGHGDITISMAHGSSSRYVIVECEKGNLFVDFSRQLMIPQLHNGFFGPLSRKFGGIGQGLKFVGATTGVMAKVLSGRMKANPGTRGLIVKFYEAVRSDLPCPLSEENALGVAKIIDVFIDRDHSNAVSFHPTRAEA